MFLVVMGGSRERQSMASMSHNTMDLHGLIQGTFTIFTINVSTALLLSVHMHTVHANCLRH
jgi:hypothetical protein